VFCPHKKVLVLSFHQQPKTPPPPPHKNFKDENEYRNIVLKHHFITHGWWMMIFIVFLFFILHSISPTTKIWNGWSGGFLLSLGHFKFFVYIYCEGSIEVGRKRRFLFFFLFLFSKPPLSRLTGKGEAMNLETKLCCCGKSEFAKRVGMVFSFFFKFSQAFLMEYNMRVEWRWLFFHSPNLTKP